MNKDNPHTHTQRTFISATQMLVRPSTNSIASWHAKTSERAGVFGCAGASRHAGAYKPAGGLENDFEIIITLDLGILA